MIDKTKKYCYFICMRKLESKMQKAINDFDLIRDGDKIAVGLSGGKDSLILLKLLNNFKRYSKQSFSLIAICVDISNGKTNFDKMKRFCKDHNVELHIINSDIQNIVFNIRNEKNPCSLCANLRRGILNSSAKELGCTKVALAHHYDDMIETFLLNFLFEGRLDTFKPKTYLSRVDIEVIRPLIYIEESEIKQKTIDFEITKNPCPVNHKTKREEMKNLVENLKKYQPEIKKRIFNIIKNNILN